MPTRDVLVHSAALSDLRPTQITVGYREVAEKRRRWSDLPAARRSHFLRRHPIPVLLGPKRRFFVVDHHHLARALVEDGCETAEVSVIADLSSLGRHAFWVFADRHGWCHPYDAAGCRVEFDLIPKRIADLADDPFRSLAGALRRAGGFSKAAIPFSEFFWADALRRKLDAATVEGCFAGALAEALAFARSHAALGLPGWRGPSEMAA